MIYNRQVIKKTCWLLLYSLVLLGCSVSATGTVSGFDAMLAIIDLRHN